MNKLRQENRSPTRVVYTLAGREVHPGDELEYLTPLGWVRGSFEWSGNLFQWARLLVPYGDDPDQLMIVVLPPLGAQCRWPRHSGGKAARDEVEATVP